jgi:hypothetical protein
MNKTAPCGCSRSRPTSRESTSCLPTAAEPDRATRDRQKIPLPTDVGLIAQYLVRGMAPAQASSESADPTCLVTVQCGRRYPLGYSFGPSIVLFGSDVNPNKTDLERNFVPRAGPLLDWPKRHAGRNVGEEKRRCNENAYDQNRSQCSSMSAVSVALCLASIPPEPSIRPIFMGFFVRET